MELEEQAAAPLAGGLMQGYQCGMIWGAALAAGAQVYRKLGKGPQAQARAMIAARRVLESFRAQNNNINCMEITEVDLSSPTLKMVARFLIKSGGGCFRMAARYPEAAFGEIHAVLSEEDLEMSDGPVSCAAVLAQKMGASDMQAVMAAGLAGGIGLSGGACGALGAAIWITRMNLSEETAEQTGLNAPDASAVIERFLKCTNYEFECCKIVGRPFEGIADHANYLRAGGCSAIIEGLASQ
jgi:hypothetical protein